MSSRRRGFTPAAAGVLLAGAVFAEDTAAALSNSRLGPDVPIALWVQSVPWGPLTALFAAANWGGESWHPVAIALACFVACLGLAGPRAMLIAPAALASLFTALIKVRVDRPRPLSNLVHVAHPVHGFSYPSGHATFYGWLAVIVVAILAPRLGRGLPAAWLGAAAVVTIACLARVYVGAHWPSDVVAGAALGGGWAGLVALAWAGPPGRAARRAYRKWKSSPPP